MELQKVAVKIFTEDRRLSLTDFIDVFHGWIQASDGIYHDVADYSHMQAGPGIILLANRANIAIDESGNRRGLLFTQKSRATGANRDLLAGALRAALENCRKLADDAKLKGDLKFSGREIAIAINDRLIGPNNQATFAALQPDIEALARALFAGTGFSVQRDGRARQRFNVTITAEHNFDIQALLSNLRSA